VQQQELGVTGQLEAGLLARQGAHRRAHQPAVASNAVVDVDHQVARLQLGDERLARRGSFLGHQPAGGRRPALLGPAENLAIGEQRQAERVRDPPFAQQSVDELDLAW
jgi:hypothetical protein